MDNKGSFLLQYISNCAGTFKFSMFLFSSTIIDFIFIVCKMLNWLYFAEMHKFKVFVSFLTIFNIILDILKKRINYTCRKTLHVKHHDLNNYFLKVAKLCRRIYIYHVCARIRSYIHTPSYSLSANVKNFFLVSPPGLTFVDVKWCCFEKEYKY